MNISYKVSGIIALSRFPQPDLFSHTTFDVKLSVPTAKQKKIFMNLIPRNLKHLLRTKTSKETPFKIFKFTITTLKVQDK